MSLKNWRKKQILSITFSHKNMFEVDNFSTFEIKTYRFLKKRQFIVQMNNRNNYLPFLREKSGCDPARATDLVPLEENMSIFMKNYKDKLMTVFKRGPSVL
jgi:hypothetical protein